MRILLFLATNLAVILVASFTLRLLDVDSYLAQNGIEYGSLLAFGINRGHRSDLGALFMTHPPLEQRIQALQQAKL
ncbi:heat shock protein HtpX [Marinobacter sp. LV10R520-4]|nr:heat shock protein HtpX [Marinobacter sp. LV10R520-4]